MMKKALIVAAVVVAVVLGGGTLLLRAMLNPENVRRTLEAQASAALGQPVTIGTAELGLWPRAGVTLGNTVVGQPAVLTLTRTELSTSMRALLGRRIEDAEVRIEDSDVDLPLALAALDRLTTSGTTGGGGTGGAAAGDESPGVTFVSVRRFALHDVRVQAGSRSAVFNLESALDGDRLTIDSASVTSDVTSLEATGTIDSLSQRRGQVSIRADSLDLDGLVVFAGEFSQPAAPSPSSATAATTMGPIDLTLTIEAAKGRAAGVPFEALTATAHVGPDGVRFDPLAFGAFGGQVAGTLAVALAGAEPSVAVDGKVAGMDMARLTEFAGKPGSMTGTLAGSFAVSGHGADPQEALAAASGQGTAAISDGTMEGLDLVRQIVLAFGKPAGTQPESGGERFSRLGAHFQLARDVLSLSDLSFVSRDVQMDGTGTLRIEGGRLDVHANARLSKELTAQAGRDLVRYTAENGQVTLPVIVTGTIDAPSVGVDLASATRRALSNELQRQTESAIRDLFKRKKPQER